MYSEFGVALVVLGARHSDSSHMQTKNPMRILLKIPPGLMDVQCKKLHTKPVS